MTYSDKHIYSTLARLHTTPDAHQFITLKALSQAADTPRVTCQRAMKRLQAERRIEAVVVLGRNGGYSYRILNNGSDHE